jgi:hypothetical protein
MIKDNGERKAAKINSLGLQCETVDFTGLAEGVLRVYKARLRIGETITRGFEKWPSNGPYLLLSQMRPGAI